MCTPVCLVCTMQLSKEEKKMEISDWKLAGGSVLNHLDWNLVKEILVMG